MFKICISAVLATILSAGLAMAAPLDGDQTYALLFKDGTLDDIDRNAELVYRRDVTNVLKPEAGSRDTGQIALTFGEDDLSMAKLEFRQDTRHRVMGQFPASVGNPMIMVFYEAVVRDMAEAAGGSPYYIRNRVKESLIKTSDVVDGEAVVDGKTIATKTIRMHPFADDPNVARMQGFGDLVLSVTISEDVPGWYVSLLAEAQPTGGDAVYRSEMQFERLEAGQ